MTEKQAELLALLKELITPEGVSPSYDELAQRMGQASKSGICRLLDALAEQGRIRRSAHRARSIEIVEVLPPKRLAIRRALDLAIERHGDEVDGRIVMIVTPSELEAVLGEAL